MKKLLIITIMVIVHVSCKQNKNEAQEINQIIEPELVGVQKWFDAWELVAKEIVKLPDHDPPLMLFYDSEYLYTNSAGKLGDGVKVTGPSFFGKELSWIKIKHNDSITLPTGLRVPVGLMSFTGSIENGSKDAFFVMGVPSFWKNANVKSKELGDENLYTSVFLHEFAHSQQNKNFGVKLDEFDRNYEFELELNDDMIQEVFKNDSQYTEDIKSEIKTFYKAASADDINEAKIIAKKGLEKYNKRQQQYFTKDREVYTSIDNFFLTMEGIGQYVAVAWLIHPKGADLNMQVAVDGMRRGGRWWSQDEGLALFLIYTKIAKPNLAKEMFGTDLKAINELLELQLK